MLSLIKHPKGISFKVYVQPKSSKNQITGMYGGALKIKITAPPVDGAANKMCLKYLSKCLSVPMSRLEIITGQSSRTKYVLLRSENDKVDANDIKLLKKHIEKFLCPKETT
jgi:uncharacterized protein (TIGR00251 family)